MSYRIIGGVERPRVLFLCVHNSARSQIAEGLLRSMAGDHVVARSAGLEAGRLRPEAVRVMSELGLDISAQRSKSVDELANEHFDIVVTTCDEAKEACPLFRGAFETLHWGIADPAAVEGSEETRLEAFREARDELWAHVAALSRDLERTQFVSSRKR
ncbi:MAG TPA: arsenate reductase ArsC [Candidatus Polarisedimenticolia bacterium]|nr:arsenate reductase ArsC [Candidatus Polarisedimenticolia bacterium]